MVYVNAACIYFVAVHSGCMVTAKDILRHRTRLGESQAEFARRFKVNQSTIHRWETGRLPIEGIIEIGVLAVLADLAVQRSRRGDAR